jgi:hypothetical protein
MDLKVMRLKNGAKILCAATHGRGVYERTLDSAAKSGVEFYIRATQLDLRRFPLNAADVGSSPDIKLDATAGKIGCFVG